MIASSTLITNRRLARCARCRSTVRPGAGAPYLGAYLCADCTRVASAEEQALEASHWALEVIGRALDWSRPLGFVDRERVTKAIRQHLARGARNATLAAIRIERGEKFTVWQIVDLIAGDDAG